MRGGDVLVAPYHRTGTRALGEAAAERVADRAAVERMFANNNPPTVLGTAQAAGVAIAAAARGLPSAANNSSYVRSAG